MVGRCNAAELGSGIASAGPIALSFATVTSNDEGPNLLVGGELSSFGSAIGLAGGNCVFSPIASVRSLGYNVEALTDSMGQPVAGCGLDSPTDRTLHPWLSAIGDHGGPTATKVPRSGSPLIDAIPATEPACAGTDQRGIRRPLRSACDIGAVEVRTPVAHDAARSVPAGGELAIDLRSLVDDPDEVLGNDAVGAPAHGALFPTVTGYTGPNCQVGPDDIEDGGPVTLVCRVLFPPGPGAPMTGSLFPRGLGVISYVPATGYAGSDAVAFVLCSEGGVICTETRSIAITVTAAAPTPIPVEPRFTG